MVTILFHMTVKAGREEEFGELAVQLTAARAMMAPPQLTAIVRRRKDAKRPLFVLRTCKGR